MASPDAHALLPLIAASLSLTGVALVAGTLGACKKDSCPHAGLCQAQAITRTWPPSRSRR